MADADEEWNIDCSVHGEEPFVGTTAKARGSPPVDFNHDRQRGVAVDGAGSFNGCMGQFEADDERQPKLRCAEDDQQQERKDKRELDQSLPTAMPHRSREM